MRVPGGALTGRLDGRSDGFYSSEWPWCIQVRMPFTNCAGSRSTSARSLVTMALRTLPSTPASAVSKSFSPLSAAAWATRARSVLALSAMSAPLESGASLPAYAGDAQNIRGAGGAKGYAGGDYQFVKGFAEAVGGGHRAGDLDHFPEARAVARGQAIDPPDQRQPARRRLARGQADDVHGRPLARDPERGQAGGRVGDDRRGIDRPR